MEQLTVDFEAKNRSKDYKKVVIPAYKKNNMAANSADIKEKAISVTGWEEKKYSLAAENAWKTKLKGVIEPKINDQANKDKKISGKILM